MHSDIITTIHLLFKNSKKQNKKNLELYHFPCGSTFKKTTQKVLFLQWLLKGILKEVILVILDTKSKHQSHVY